MPTGNHLTRAQYASVQIACMTTDLRYLVRRAEALRRKGKAVPPRDLAKMATLRADIARIRAGDFVTVGELNGS
jgi:hypothetical protein